MDRKLRTSPSSPGRALLVTLLALLAIRPAAAQELPPSIPTPLIGSWTDDALRLRQLTSAEPADRFLFRSLSGQLRPATDDERLELLDPVGSLIVNSEIPFSINQGPLWAGRGANLMVMAGGRASWRSFELVFAPQFTWSQNLDYQTIASDDTTRSQFASPWHIGDQSADLPLRFGDLPLFQASLGQSSISARTRGVRLGATTENEWWGPGVRNAILISNNAEGFPRLFVETDRPLETGFGSFEGRWILGTLTESPYFDRAEENDLRALNGAIAVYRPPGLENLSLGIGRVVYSPVTSSGATLAHGLDVVTWLRNQVLPPDSTIADEGRLDDLLAQAGEPYDHEQITSLFGRWILPEDGLELYFEWARLALPTSPMDLLVEPNHSQGFTLGFQWARPTAGEAFFRLQGETTYLEESSTFNNRPVPSFYVSRAIPQGYTHQGRVVGAAVGPGGSSQWLAGDYLAEGWHFGGMLGRIRWDNDVYYRGEERREVGHDVTIFAGLRGGGEFHGAAVQAELIPSYRFNYLFQNPTLEPRGIFAIDKANLTIQLSVTPLRAED